MATTRLSIVGLLLLLIAERVQSNSTLGNQETNTQEKHPMPQVGDEEETEYEYVTSEIEYKFEDDDKEESESKMFDKDKHFIITERDGKKINVTFPLVHVSLGERKGHTVKAFIDAYEKFEGIEKFQLIIQQGEKEGILSTSNKVYNWEEANKAYEEKGSFYPYITAELSEFGASPLEFLIGDKMTYGGYYNGPLVYDKEPYTLRLRGIVKDRDHEKIVIDTDVIGKIEKANQIHIISAGGVSVCMVVIFGFIVSHCLRKRREKQRVARTIAKFNEMLAGDKRPATQPAAKKNQTPAVPTSKSGYTNDSSEWWTLTESEYQTEQSNYGEQKQNVSQYDNQYGDQYGEQNGDYHGNYYEDQLYDDHYGDGLDDPTLGVQYSAVEAASRLLSEADRNIVTRRKGTMDSFRGGFS
ncbi:hypothetical protein ACHWQZ_G001710 [Mnemiopsis leidyi]